MNTRQKIMTGLSGNSLLLRLSTLVALSLLCCETSIAQQLPPRPFNIYVSPTQGLNFGAFFQGAAGGTVIIYPNGTRSTTGGVIPANLGFLHSPALFEIDAEPGTPISIVSGSNVTLNGSNGGTMNLAVGALSLGSSFIATALPPSRTMLYVGGILTVGNNLTSPPGNYSGVFDLIFFQQ
jgi:hypothetical protein